MKATLIGKTLRHSFSAEIHRALGTDYDLTELTETELDTFMKDPPVDCFNVTIPYKEAVMPYLDELDESAKYVGCVNTVKRAGDKLIGYNTDIDGMAYLFSRAGVSLTDKTVVVLGSGGTSKTARALAKREGAKKVYLVSRTGEYNYENIGRLTDAEILINTTPVGMFPRDGLSAVNPAIFPNLIFVADPVYNPLRTYITEQAREIGVKASCGLSMLVYQAIKAEEIWTGKKISDDVTEKIVSALAAQKDNIVLVGMPSCGKTTVGRLVAEKTGKTFVDLDEEIVKREGRTIPKIFTEAGEEYFRKVESEVAREVLSGGGQVVSTGGGTPVAEKNRYEIRKNGFVVYLTRPLDRLVADGRPVSKNEGVERIFAERDGIYRDVADAIIANDKAADETASEVVKTYEKNSRY